LSVLEKNIPVYNQNISLTKSINMKHFFIPTLVFIAVLAQAQEFAPIGARWNYDVNDSGNYLEKYQFTSVKDTAIEDKVFRKIEIVNYKKNPTKLGDYTEFKEDIDTLEPHFVYQNADSVYLFDPFNSMEFDKIYVFNVKKGDTITLDTPFGEELNNDDKTFRIKIDSVAVEEYGGVQLKKYRTKALDEIGHGFAGVWYMDRVGSLDWFLPRPLFGIPERPGPLLCYSDSEVNYPSGTTCETITSNIEAQLKFASVYPNPAKDLVSINASQNIEKVEVLSVRGDLLATFHTNQANLSAMKPGVYFLKIYSGGDFAVKKIIKE
jgi:hypothetical protein